VESDWKKFSAMLPIWRERYLAECNARIARVLTNSKKAETERFWDAEAQIQKEAKALRRCLDDISRSKMWLRLMEMRAAGMIRREDLAEFSEELRKQVFDDPFARRANKAPEPTTFAVTSRAIVRLIEMKQQNPNCDAARAAPAKVVAHLTSEVIRRA
jgi:hypothetical protein